MDDHRHHRKRAYLHRNPDTPAVSVDFHNLASQGANLSAMFEQLTRELSRSYAINRGVLVVRRRDTGGLSAVSTWNDGAVRDGLAVNFPTETSLFEKVAEHGAVYTEDFCGSFSGNFFERKLLLGEDSRSFVVQPLSSDGEVIALVAYSSKEPTAFVMFEEGHIDRVARDFASAIRKQTHPQ